MNKILEPERYRCFLIEDLPEPLTKASSHLQIVDRYLADTAVRCRQTRDPQSNTLNFSLQKRSMIGGADKPMFRLDEIHLDQVEFFALERLVSREIRKNRYYHEFDRRLMIFDVYLGALSGLRIARIEFRDDQEMVDFEPPPFAVFEITNDPFFESGQLAGKSYDAVRAEVDNLGQITPKSNPDE